MNTLLSSIVVLRYLEDFPIVMVWFPSFFALTNSPPSPKLPKARNEAVQCSGLHCQLQLANSMCALPQVESWGVQRWQVTILSPTVSITG